jgi:predicted kinase
MGGSEHVNSVQDAKSRSPRTLVGGAVRGPLVVVAGIPGAGKATALHEFVDSCPPGGPLVVDSDSVHRRIRARLPGVPYPVQRPLVHVVHWVRVVILAVTEPRPLLIHETATRALSRALLLRIARLARRPARMVWIDVDAETARQGQLARERVIRSRAFQRHLRWVNRSNPPQAALTTWDTVRRTDREGAVHAIRALAGHSLPARSTADQVIDPAG